MESTIDLPCPLCGKGGYKMLAMSTDLAYFGEHTQITLICESCGWKHTDFIPSEGEKPGAWSLSLDSEEKMAARVVRSSSCTIRITGLDLEVTPGSASSGFISNVEGVIKRFEDAIGVLIRGSSEDSGDSSLGEANELLARLEEVKGGGTDSRILLLDPRGRSQILHKDAESRDLTQEEEAVLEEGGGPVDLGVG